MIPFFYDFMTDKIIFKLYLPYPVSVNSLYHNVLISTTKSYGRRYTKKYKDWLNLADNYFLFHRMLGLLPNKITPYNEEVDVLYEVERKSARADIGNCEKCLSDFISKRTNLIKNDNLIRKVTSQWVEPNSLPDLNINGIIMPVKTRITIYKAGTDKN